MNDTAGLHDILRHNAEAEIERIAATAQAGVGVVARHLGTGQELAYGDRDRYPLASSVKMALAAAVLDGVQRGDLALTDMIEVRDEEMTLTGPIGAEFPHPGVRLSLANLLEVMMTWSCNTATDVLFRVAGGPQAVAGYLERIGLRGFEVSRSMRTALCVLHELSLPPEHVSVRQWLLQQPPEVLDARERVHGPGADYQHEHRDHCEPRAMLELLERIWKGELLQPPLRDLLLAIMRRCRTSGNRIRARLPPDVSTGTKSGSGAGTAVDVGYIDLSGRRGTAAVALFVKASPLTMADRERVIADITRLIYDYYVIVTPPAV